MFPEELISYDRPVPTVDEYDAFLPQYAMNMMRLSLSLSATTMTCIDHHHLLTHQYTRRYPTA